MAAALRALTAERNGLQSDLSAKCAALAAAEQLTANARVELEQHCKEAAAHREAAEKVPDSLLCVVCMLGTCHWIWPQHACVSGHQAS